MASTRLHSFNPALVEPNAPYNVTVVPGNFFGWPFNGLNDLEVLKGGEGGETVFFAGVQ